MPALLPAAWVAALCHAGAGCGDSLVPGDSYDDSMFAFSGSVVPARGIQGARNCADSGPAVRPLVRVLWIDPLQRNPDLPAPANALRSTVRPEDDTFAVEVFRPPPPGALFELGAPSGETAILAVAEIVVIDDADGDGTFRVSGPRAEIAAPDVYLGSAVHLLLYVVRPYGAPQETFPLQSSGGTGYELLNYACSGAVFLGTVPSVLDDVQLLFQPSMTFPDARNCLRSHSP